MKKIMFVLVILCGALLVYVAILTAPTMEQEASTFVKVFASAMLVMSVYGMAEWAKKFAPESKNERDERLYLSHNLGQLNAFLSGRKGI